MGADDLIANGKDVAIIDYHTGDNYENSYGLSRLSYYGLTGTPTAWFDGGNKVVGGNHTASMYGNYLPKYNLRKGIQSSFTIDVDGSNSGLINYELNVTVEKVAATTATNLTLHVVVTESDIQQSWQGMSELNHVERIMSPNQNGTALDFSGNDILEKTINFNMNPDWVTENCEVVIFVQNMSTKEILQGIKRDLTEFGTTNANDAALLNVAAPQTVCNDVFQPKIEIANYGLDNLTSVDIVYDINGGTPYTISWSGDLATYESEIVVLDPVSFTIQASNTFNVNLENPNGQSDEFPSNNSQILVLEEAPNVTSPVSLALKLDDHPEEVTWEVVNAAGDILYSGGPYTTSGQFVVEQFVLDNMDCYAFKIYDEGGDGITGTGSYKLAYQGSMIFAEGKDFGFEDQIQFGIGLTGVDDQLVEAGFAVYPNPVEKQAVIEVSMTEPSELNISVYNTIGKLVYQSGMESLNAGKHNFAFDRNGLEPGIYFVQVKTGESLFTRKIVLK